jgi:hypothetical protein
LQEPQVVAALRWDGVRLRKYIEACPSGFGDGSGRMLKMAEVVGRLGAWPEWHAAEGWVARFRDLLERSLDAYFLGLPDAFLTEPRRELAVKFLGARLDWLTEHLQ